MVEIRIADPDADGIGEVLARSPTVMNGYVGVDPALNTETVDADGWLHSGDLGHLTEDGYLFIDGRSKDVVSGGREHRLPPRRGGDRQPSRRRRGGGAWRSDPDLGEELVAVVVHQADAEPPTAKELPVTSPACCPTSRFPRGGRSARSRCRPWPARRSTRRKLRRSFVAEIRRSPRRFAGPLRVTVAR